MECAGDLQFTNILQAAMYVCKSTKNIYSFRDNNYADFH